MSEITLKNQLDSPLLRLPAEIRNKIYTYVSLSTKIEVIGVLEDLSPNYTFYLRAPGFVKSCKQIHHEATTLLYSLATFDITNHSWGFLRQSGFIRTIRTLITSIRMSGFLADSVISGRERSRPWGSASSAGDLPGLERVHLQSVYWGRKDNYSAAMSKWFENESLEIIFDHYAG
ncbi:uncharacterized protein J4E78_009707 [Alternaria triticimaculans]|uniref:uncharacterized protein n=1 Tax=Alternaria triticimaculans TaxID=297637 RepID=UPI0020C2B9B1|nr:uncharacterized protein J4E78_009707 [Alternaria triticimaculans]KAI4644123.1 hypothetical protein J4E78_009707 [Alternaria triticimaculans]